MRYALDFVVVAAPPVGELDWRLEVEKVAVGEKPSRKTRTRTRTRTGRVARTLGQ